LAQTERQRQRPPGTVPPLGRGFQEALNLRHIVWLDVVRVRLWRLGQEHGIASQVGPPHRFVERGPERAMDVVDAAR
jgi:hypothetical protein